MQKIPIRELLLLFLMASATAAVAGQGNLVEQRLEAEQESYKNSFLLVPHKPNYILPFTYQTDPNQELYQGSNAELQHAEIKFQLSFKVPVTRQTLFDENGYLYFAYTAQSLWQAYNADESSPFRDTNHEPEIFLNFMHTGVWHGISMPLTTFGFSHQSNGQSGVFSRSWNRLYMEAVFHYEDLYVGIKPWWRIPEQEKRGALDATGDDNPDIHHYYGYGEIRAFRQLGNNQISVLLRNSLHGWQRGAVEINYSYPVNDQVQAYIQLFHGYGETLLDYNHSNSRIGFGFLFSNWL